ncbi:MAG: hypothetical protein JSW73_01630 [Candidatus Woesearchaeota archaeon]|nr:MAG: hypothetical protein JSW73_01630 [Candidatus Woesearchaeota archaeon]
MVFGTKRLIRKEIRSLKKVIKELDDVEGRTQKSIEILKKISSFLEQGGQSDKAKKLRGEIVLLEKEIYEDKKAERLALLVEEKLPRIMKGQG